MIFEWDETKNRANVRKHGLHFAHARRLRRKALERNWYDPRTPDCCRLYRTGPRNHSHYFVEKGTL